MLGGISDMRNMVLKTTRKRVVNMGDIFLSYQRSRFSGIPAIKGLPISISIEPTTSCNLRCPECPSGLRSFTRPTGMLEATLYRKIIDELAPTLSYLTFYFQGEPFLNPAFIDMASYASAKGIYTATSTNGHYLKDDVSRATVESGLDRLIISIDGTTQETYEAYRVGGSLDKVIAGTENIVRWKKELRSLTPHVVFQFLVVKPNEHQVADVQKLAKKLGVDQVALKTAQIYNYKEGSGLIPENDRYSRYRKNEDGTYSVKNSLLNQCWKMWNSCVVTWDGKVVPCCFDKDASYVLGDLKHEKFSDVWSGEKYNAFRSSLLKSRSEIEMCRNCTEGTRVWA